MSFFSWANGLDLPLYAWAEVVTGGIFPSPVAFSIYMASGSEGRFCRTPSYEAFFNSDGSPVIQMVGRTGRDHVSSGCALVSLQCFYFPAFPTVPETVQRLANKQQIGP